MRNPYYKVIKRFCSLKRQLPQINSFSQLSRILEVVQQELQDSSQLFPFFHLNHPFLDLLSVDGDGDEVGEALGLDGGLDVGLDEDEADEALGLDEVLDAIHDAHDAHDAHDVYVDAIHDDAHANVVYDGLCDDANQDEDANGGLDDVRGVLGASDYLKDLRSYRNLKIHRNNQSNLMRQLEVLHQLVQLDIGVLEEQDPLRWIL